MLNCDAVLVTIQHVHLCTRNKLCDFCRPRGWDRAVLGAPYYTYRVASFIVESGRCVRATPSLGASVSNEPELVL